MASGSISHQDFQHHCQQCHIYAIIIVIIANTFIEYLLCAEHFLSSICTHVILSTTPNVWRSTIAISSLQMRKLRPREPPYCLSSHSDEIAEPGFNTGAMTMQPKHLTSRLCNKGHQAGNLMKQGKQSCSQGLGSYRVLGEAITFRKIYKHIFTNFQRTYPPPPGPHVEL